MKRFLASVLCLSAVILTSCCCPRCCEEMKKEKELNKRFGVDSPRPVVNVAKCDAPIVLDGKLDDPAWAKATPYQMALPFTGRDMLPKVKATRDKEPFEGAEVKYLYTNDTLYIGVKLQDTDVYQNGTEDQSHFYQQGDLVEVFLKPENASAYWEIYGTPNNLKTTFRFTARGCGRADWGELDPAFNCAATVQGTLNKSDDKDGGWTIEMAFPFKMLEAFCGVPFAKGQKWTCLVARYNYNNSNTGYQNSSVPMLPQASYHLIEYYAALNLLD